MILGWKIGVIAGVFVLFLPISGAIAEKTGWASQVGGERLEQNISERHFIRVAQLRTRYLQALLRLEERLTRDRKIEDALQVRSEVERFRRGNLAPDLNVNRLAKLRELGRIYTDEVRKISVEFELEMTAFRKRRGEEFASKQVAKPRDSS